MEQFSAISNILNWFQEVGAFIWRYIKLATHWIWQKTQQLGAWLNTHLPFLKGRIARHLSNPAILIEDIAILVLIIYLLFGFVGYLLVYQAKSESRFTEDLSILYPLPAARVDNSLIWNHQYLERLRFLTTFNKQSAGSATPALSDQQLRTELMSELVQEKIIYDQAQTLGVSVSEAELQASYKQQQAAAPNFEQKIAQLYDMTPSQFQDILATQLLKSKVESVEIVQIHVFQILTTTQDAANQAEAALKGGTSFAAVAAQFSQDNQTKGKGGDLGYWTKSELASQIDPAIEQAAFGLAVNQISAPIQTKYGYHIIEVTQRTGKNYETFDEWYAGVLKQYSVRYYTPL